MATSNILTATVTITGIRPLLWHVFGPESIPLEKGEKTGVGGNDPEEWKKTYTATKEGQLYVDPSYIFACIRDGGRHTKVNRSTLMSPISSTLQVTDEIVLTDRFLPEGTPETDKTLPVYLDIRGVKNPATKGRNIRYRVAAATGWQMTFHLLWDKTVVNRTQMEAATIDAGRLSGIGDGRGIGMGRFEVTSFEVD